MEQFSDAMRRSGVAIWIALAFFAILLLATGTLFFRLLKVSDPVLGASLPMIAVGSVIALILVLATIALLFWTLGLANKDQALGLPDGSIRAVIALSLIVLFAILSVFLYKSLQNTGTPATLVHQTEAQIEKFIADHPNVRGIRSELAVDEAGKPFIRKGSDGKLEEQDGLPVYRYNLTYLTPGASTPVSDEFAKQLLVLLGTLMTAITSFYLGANTVTSARTAAQAEATASSRPTISGIDPPTFVRSSTDPLRLKVSGANLNSIVNAKIVKDDKQFIAKVESSTNSVTCTFDVDELKNADLGDWSVVLDDGGAISVTAPMKLKLTE